MADKKVGAEEAKKAEAKEAKKAEAKEAKKAEAKKRAKSSKKNKKPNAFTRLLKYLGACRGELRKITWPTAKQTTKNFGIVLVVIIIMGLFIFALDRGLYALLGLVMNTSA